MRSLEYRSVVQSDGQESWEASTRRKRKFRYLCFRRRRRAWIVVATVLAVVFAVRHGVASRRQRNQPSHSSPPVVNDVATPSPPAEECDAHYECKTDRLGHNSPLYPAQAICNKNYMLGVSRNGHDFRWRDCATNETNSYYSNSTASLVFVMRPDASWNVLDNVTGEVLWEEKCTRDVKVYPQCLSRPLLDCPYLHLRRGGEIVLNWIDGDTWMDRNIKRVYKGFHL